MDKSSRIIKSEALRYLIMGALFGFLFPIVGTIIKISASDLPLIISSARIVQSTDPLLWIIDTAPVFLGFFAYLAGKRQDKTLNLNLQLSMKENELEAIQNNIKQVVEEQTQALHKASQTTDKKNKQLTAISSVASSIAQIRDLDQLLLRITTLLSDSLGYYHIGIFLLDVDNQYAVLRSSNSEGGQRMFERGHKLKIGESSIVGYVASIRKPRIVSVTEADAIYFDNPDLPETKSEMALPLHISDRLIGVLDIQSKETSAFQESDIEVFQTLADQIAIAIENTRLFSETQKALIETKKTYAEFVKESWVQYIQARIRIGYKFSGNDSQPITNPLIYPEIEQAIASGEVIWETKKHTALAIPMVIQGETIGVLDVRLTDKHKWNDETLDIVRKIAERATLALENARLIEESQRRAAVEQAIGEIALKIGSSVNLSNILQTTAEELGRALPG
jgi:GAF domain-containing protein